MERFTSLLSCLGWLLSPTRKVIDLLKQGDRNRRSKMLRVWSLGLFALELLLLVALAITFQKPQVEQVGYVSIALIVYAYSRINEIAYAFYRDPLSKKKRSSLSAENRVRMVMRSYFGLTCNFAILYYFVPIKDLFKVPLVSFFEAFYFSGVTVATLGYGDVLPAHWLSRMLALYEVSLGILLVAVAIAVYIGAKEPEGDDDQAGNATCDQKTDA